MTEFFVAEKVKWTYTDKQYVADSLLFIIYNNLRGYTVQLVIPDVCTKYQNSKLSSFREISDGKRFANRQTDKHSYRKGKKLYTPYKLRMPGV